MADTVSTLFKSIEEILRYVAPGFVAVGFLLIAFPDYQHYFPTITVGHEYVLLIMALLFGVVLNSCHSALFEDWWCWVVVACQCRTLKAHQKMRTLEEKREVRRTKTPELAAFQARHDRHGATLTFLFCASYPAFVIAGYQLWKGLDVQWPILVAGILFFVCGVASDWKYTRTDLWAANDFK